MKIRDRRIGHADGSPFFCPLIPAADYCRLARFSRNLGLLAHETGTNALLHVGLQHAERLLVPLNRQLQGVQHPLGREEIRDDPLGDGDRLRGNAKGLRIETKIDDQLLRRARNAAEIGVKRQRLRIVNFDLGTLLGLAAAAWGVSGWISSSLDTANSLLQD